MGWARVGWDRGVWSGWGDVWWSLLLLQASDIGQVQSVDLRQVQVQVLLHLFVGWAVVG